MTSATGWRALAWRGYEHLPRSADGPLRAGTRLLLPIVNRRVPLALLRGPALSGDAAAVLVAGATPPYLPRRFFAAEPTHETLGHVPIWQLGAELPDGYVAERFVRGLGGEEPARQVRRGRPGDQHRRRVAGERGPPQQGERHPPIHDRQQETRTGAERAVGRSRQVLVAAPRQRAPAGRRRHAAASHQGKCQLRYCSG